MCANDLKDEMASRDEEKEWNLNPCPCCGSDGDVCRRPEGIVIICSRWGCREVEGKTMEDAAFLWNQPRFSQGKP
jgi:hypothetical protein